MNLKYKKLKTESQENLKRNEKQTCNLQETPYSDQISQQRPHRPGQSGGDMFKVLKAKNWHPRTPCPENLSFRNEGNVKTAVEQK